MTESPAPTDSPPEVVVGVLAIQGDVSEHEAALRRVGAVPRRVRRTEDLDGLNGLIIPGGESTTIGMLAAERGLLEPMRAFLEAGRPTWGTCAGLILLAEDVGHAQPLVGGLDIDVDRNGFGRQVDSFELDLRVEGIGAEPFRAVFIRAPKIDRVGPAIRSLAELPDGTVVAAGRGRILVTAFHPELTGDDRLHARFVEWCRHGAADERAA